MIKKISLKQAGIIAILVYVLTIGVHLLVIAQIIPYTWVNGGRSATFEIARQLSVNSIPLFLIDIPVTLFACGIIRVKWNRVAKVILSIWLWFGVALTALGFVQQLLGTTFEKCVMSVICAVGIIAGIRLAIEKR